MERAKPLLPDPSSAHLAFRSAPASSPRTLPGAAFKLGCDDRMIVARYSFYRQRVSSNLFVRSRSPSPTVTQCTASDGS